jgi:hypothetical protein
MSDFVLQRFGDAYCMDEVDIRHLQAKPWEKLTVVTNSGERFRRKMVRVVSGERQYWADRTTGTLYRPDGTCCSSSRLRIDAG